MVDFLVIGPFGSVVYANVFPLIKDQKMSVGYIKVSEFSDGTKFGNINWFTSFDVEQRGYLKLKEYKEGDYKEYDHFKAINIDSIKDIPDYDGVMGVPVTFLEKWNKDQFEVLDARNYRKDDKFKDMNVQTLSGSGGEMSAVEGYKKYDRILIKKK